MTPSEDEHQQGDYSEYDEDCVEVYDHPVFPLSFDALIAPSYSQYM